MEQPKREITEQEAFWEGAFGDDYCGRNQSVAQQAASIAFFAKALAKIRDIRSAVEFGANIGLCLYALRTLFPAMPLTGVEINPKAAQTLGARVANVEVLRQSFLDLGASRTWDLTFTRGVLIHIAPDMLPLAYQALYAASNRYILLAEYYNPTPVKIAYRGHDERLFKRDFAGEMLDAYSDLELVDYGFIYHRDFVSPQDDITYFLMRKH